MKKIAVVVLAMALLMMLAVVPVMAKPPGEQKVPVKVTFTITSSTTVDRWLTGGNISHRVQSQVWSVDLIIDDSSTPIKGTAEVTRNTDYRYTKPGGVDQIINDDYVFSFPTAEEDSRVTLTQ